MLMALAPRKQRGFTLIELMIVVVIVSILMAVGLPAYQNQVRKSKRSVGKGELLKVAARQEQFFVNNKRYVIADLTSLGYADGSDGYEVDSEGQPVDDGDAEAIYVIELQSADATSFLLQATPKNAQVKDKRCNVLTYSSTGERGMKDAQATDVEECW
jgi:type IV pilus assembly protein PilE